MSVCRDLANDHIGSRFAILQCLREALDEARAWGPRDRQPSAQT